MFDFTNNIKSNLALQMLIIAVFCLNRLNVQMRHLEYRISTASDNLNTELTHLQYQQEINFRNTVLPVYTSLIENNKLQQS